jgi:acyl-CoA synthetase (AMP-forming)/AMP-acid ligase II/acyl carrier protein
MASNPLPPGKRKPNSVGPAAGPEIAIMDERGDLLPQGETGEIVIRGASVMTGYASNARANQQSFTRGWFRTGDQGHLDRDGYLFVTGRLKEIINRGGEKVSPLEVDDVLVRHANVAQAVTFAIPHPTYGEDVAAAVVLRPNGQTGESDLREYLTGRLAAHKIPQRILVVEEIPKSSVGKIQRHELAERFAHLLQRQSAPLEGEAESALAQIYAEVLGVDSVTPTDNFFALGGDSLRAFQVIARVRNAFDVNLSIGTIFTKPTVRELAEEVKRVAN